MKRGRDYAPTDTMYPLGGWDYETPSTMLDPHFSPLVRNMVATDGIAAKRKGYRQLGGDIGSGNPAIIALIEFEVAIDVRILVAITTKRQYRYDTGTATWVDITKIVTGSVVEWTGTQDDTVDYVVARGVEGKYLIITNGKDKPQWWDGSAATFSDFPCSEPSFVTCKTIAQFFDHIFLGNVTTSSADRQAIAWSSVGTLADFTSFPGGTPGGDAGARIATEAIGDIVKLKNLGDRLVVYSENAIGSATFIGGVFDWSFEQVVTESRLCGAGSIVNLGPHHVFLGQQNWYIYDGNRQLRSNGDRVHKFFRNELFVEQKGRAYAFLDLPHNNVYWGVPTGDGLIGVYLQEFDLYAPGNNRWTRLDYTDVPLCMAFYSRDASRRWNDNLTIRWREDNSTWISGAGRKGFPVPVIGSYGKVFITDDSTFDDNGVPVEAFWDTPDFTVPVGYESQLARFIEIEAELRGVEVDVLYSVDQGKTFVFAGHLSVTNDWAVFKLPIDVTARNLRIRFYNKCPSSGFYMRWGRVWFKPGGAW